MDDWFSGFDAGTSIWGVVMKKLDISLFIAIVVISLFGVLMVYSSSSVWAEYKFDDPFKYLKSQGLFLIAGVILMYFVSKVNFEVYYKHPIRFLELGLFYLYWFYF